MAKFLKLTMSDALRGRQRTVHVNLDQVRVALPEAGGKTAVMFDKDHSIVACAVGAALICAAPVSVQWSPEKTLSGFFKKGPPILLRVFGGLFLSDCRCGTSDASR